LILSKVVPALLIAALGTALAFWRGDRGASFPWLLHWSRLRSSELMSLLAFLLAHPAAAASAWGSLAVGAFRRASSRRHRTRIRCRPAGALRGVLLACSSRALDARMVVSARGARRSRVRAAVRDRPAS
jgi:hypothetical protein